MKVLMLGNHNSVRGGITSVISQILEYDWNKDGIDIRFISTYKGGNTLYKVVYFAFAYIKTAIVLMTWRPDVVYMHMSHHGSVSRKYCIHKLCMKFGVPDVIHLHGSEFESWYHACSEGKQKKVRDLLRECSNLIALGKGWNRRILAIEPKTNVLVINNTVHIPREMVSWNEERLNVLFLGVMVKRKGVADLLDAIALNKKKSGQERMHFLIAGSGDEESLLRKKAADLKIDDCVEFLGWTEGKKKTELLEKSQVLVLPSYNEGLPIAVLEGISYGMPVIATDVGDMSEAVIDGYNGYLIGPGNIGQLAESLEKVNNKERFQELSANARKLAVGKFSDEKYFATLKDVLQKACCGKNDK